MTEYTLEVVCENCYNQQTLKIPYGYEFTNHNWDLINIRAHADEISDNIFYRMFPKRLQFKCSNCGSYKLYRKRR